MSDLKPLFYKTATEATRFPPGAAPKLNGLIMNDPIPVSTTEKRKKSLYIGAPACFALDLACRHVNDAFDSYGIYVVGSVLERPDWRDVDVRMIMSDEDFQSTFPNADVQAENWELDAKWLLLTVSISQWMSAQTGLPIDFQFQPQSHANKRHKKTRNAIGMRMVKRATPPSPEKE